MACGTVSVVAWSTSWDEVGVWASDSEWWVVVCGGGWLAAPMARGWGMGVEVEGCPGCPVSLPVCRGLVSAMLSVMELAACGAWLGRVGAPCLTAPASQLHPPLMLGAPLFVVGVGGMLRVPLGLVAVSMWM